MMHLLLFYSGPDFIMFAGIVIPHPFRQSIAKRKCASSKRILRKLVHTQLFDVEKDWNRFAQEGTSAELRSIVNDQSLVCCYLSINASSEHFYYNAYA